MTHYFPLPFAPSAPPDHASPSVPFSPDNYPALHASPASHVPTAPSVPFSPDISPSPSVSAV